MYSYGQPKNAWHRTDKKKTNCLSKHTYHTTYHRIFECEREYKMRIWQLPEWPHKILLHQQFVFQVLTSVDFLRAIVDGVASVLRHVHLIVGDLKCELFRYDSLQKICLASNNTFCVVCCFVWLDNVSHQRFCIVYLSLGYAQCRKKRKIRTQRYTNRFVKSNLINRIHIYNVCTNNNGCQPIKLTKKKWISNQKSDKQKKKIEITFTTASNWIYQYLLFLRFVFSCVCCPLKVTPENAIRPIIKQEKQKKNKINDINKSAQKFWRRQKQNYKARWATWKRTNCFDDSFSNAGKTMSMHRTNKQNIIRFLAKVSRSAKCVCVWGPFGG